MALLKPDNTYIVVEDVGDNYVTIRTHKDTAQRTRYKDGTTDEFEVSPQGEVNAQVDLTIKADTAKTIHDNVITAGYLALKTLEEFKTSTDV